MQTIGETKMKTLVAAVTLAAIFAAPALAQTASRHTNAQQGYSPYEESYGRTETLRHSARPNNDVYENGQYVGSDPDANVRLEMRRDNHQGD
jgi:opacity protein-like surface antigen